MKARDAAGNESAAATFSWAVDVTAPPTPTIDSGPLDPSNSTSASFSFSDSESGVTFLCRLDGGGFSACTSPKIYNSLAEGSHSFQVKARDAVGNESAAATRSWTIDTLAPPTPAIDSGPPDPSNSTSASFSFSDSESGVSFFCQLDGGGFSACSSPQAYSSLGDGSHSFQVKAQDAAGNESSTAAYSWTVHTVAPPAPTLDSTPPDPSNSTSASFSFSDSESGVSFFCQLDGGGFGACTSPKIYSGLARAPQLQGEGARRGRQRERSRRPAAGRSTSPRRRRRRSTPARPTRATRRARASPSPTASPASASSVSSTAAASAPARARRSTADSVRAPQFNVKARDAAGNESAAATFSWAVDVTAPPTPTIDSGPPRPEQLDERELLLLRQRVGRHVPLPARRRRLQRLHERRRSTAASPRAATASRSRRVTQPATRAARRSSAGRSPTRRRWSHSTRPRAAAFRTTQPRSSAASQARRSAMCLSSRSRSTAARLRQGAPLDTMIALVPPGGAYSVEAASALPDGVLTARTEQNDEGGHTGFSSANTFTVDTSAPPTPAIDSGPSDPSNSTSASFSFSDSESGVSSSAGSTAAASAPARARRSTADSVRARTRST